MSRKVPQIPQTLPTDATVMAPRDLNNIRFNLRHTILTPRRLASPPSAPASSEK